ncbi:hypothetical protein [Enhygromyxa salina]|nr:hypothetical protein [Enhygromyxa salina]
MLLLGCSRPHATEDNADSQDLPDLPTDLPIEPPEYAGVLVGLAYEFQATQFQECESGEMFEISYPGWDSVLKGSCWGVYTRIRGRLDRSFDPPRLFLEETLEARWCEPEGCAGPCTPVHDSCYAETETYPCQPVLGAGLHCGDTSYCKPVRFAATQTAGWMHHTCRPPVGHGVEGDACDYPADPGDVDTCAYGYGCWNPQGDIAAPGTCVPYCDVTGEWGPACEGTCVRCSSSEEWGLCMTGCSGDDCNVDEFC